MPTQLHPLLAPLPTDYPVKNAEGKDLFDQRDWSIGPACDCLSMQDIGLNCFCAHCCIGWYTYSRSLYYMGLGDLAVTFSAGLAQIDYGDSDLGRAAKAAANLQATLRQQERRMALIRALGLNREGDEGFFIRCCCGPCVQCQEVDTIFSFYRDSLGYRNLEYGSCWSCRCTRFYNLGRLVPFPSEIYKGESIGPNYEPTDLPNGWEFVGGVPKQRESAPEPAIMQRGSNERIK